MLIAFVASLHWFPALFARQPIGGRWWMWLAPVAVVAAIVLRLLGIDYASYAAGVVAVTFLSGLLVGLRRGDPHARHRGEDAARRGEAPSGW